MKYQILILVGIALMVEGFSSSFYSSYVLFPPTSPPMMRPVDGMEIILYRYQQIFFASGIVGIFVTLAGVFFWRKK